MWILMSIDIGMRWIVVTVSPMTSVSSSSESVVYGISSTVMSSFGVGQSEEGSEYNLVLMKFPLLIDLANYKLML
jgi:hypothetical protein